MKAETAPIVFAPYALILTGAPLALLASDQSKSHCDLFFFFLRLSSTTSAISFFSLFVSIAAVDDEEEVLLRAEKHIGEEEGEK